MVFEDIMYSAGTKVTDTHISKKNASTQVRQSHLCIDVDTVSTFFIKTFMKDVTHIAAHSTAFCHSTLQFNIVGTIYME